YYQPATGRVWQDTGTGTAARLHPGTLLYRRSCSSLQGSREAVRTDRQQLIRQLATGRLVVRDGSQLAVPVIQGSGTTRVNPTDPTWQPRPFERVSSLLASDLEFYSRPGPQSAGKSRQHLVAPVTLAATFMVYDGYGSMAEYLALGMHRAGAD